jgi:hypothetical protein
MFSVALLTRPKLMDHCNYICQELVFPQVYGDHYRYASQLFIPVESRLCKCAFHPGLPKTDAQHLCNRGSDLKQANLCTIARDGLQ